MFVCTAVCVCVCVCVTCVYKVYVCVCMCVCICVCIQGFTSFYHKYNLTIVKCHIYNKQLQTNQIDLFLDSI